MLLTKKIQILSKYSDFSNVFLKKKTLKLLKMTNFNQYTIKLKKDIQLFYRPIYNLGLIMLKTFETYIKNNPANGFIWLLKLTVNSFILFIRKLDSNFWLCVNYQSLNNLTINN